jgi:hypothetical protein
VGLPEVTIRTSFEAVMLGVETIRPIPENQAPAKAR